MRAHPYKTAPTKAFWSRAVARDWDPTDLVSTKKPLIGRADAVVSAGSCFAANIAPYLTKAGLKYLKTEDMRHPIFDRHLHENFGYDSYSAAYGNVYTARQLLQLLRRSMGTFTPSENRWPSNSNVIDPFRPGLRFLAQSDREFDVITRAHLMRTREAFAKADVFIFTLGLTEAWVSRVDGAVFPACPGTIAGEFDGDRHAFKNFTVEETVADLNEFIVELRRANPTVRIILTVSPVPLAATATGDHVLSATIYSKSVLRVAAQQAVQQHENVIYFPAYEIVTGPQTSGGYFADDRRSVSKAGVELVMRALLSHCERDPDASAKTVVPPVAKANLSALAQRISDYECEENALDRFAASN
jgi:GSCFA family